MLCNAWECPGSGAGGLQQNGGEWGEEGGLHAVQSEMQNGKEKLEVLKPCSCATCSTVSFSLLHQGEIYEMSEPINVVDAGGTTSSLG